MSRPLLVSALVYLLVLAGLATLQGGLLLLALPLALYLAAGLFYGPQAPALEARRSLSPNRISPGSLVEVHVQIQNQGGAIEELFVEDQLPAGLERVEGASSLLTGLAPGETVELRYTVRGRRGSYTFREVRASAVDRLGIFRRQASLTAAGQLFILPHAPRLPRVAIRPRQTRVYSGQIPSRQSGVGVEFYGVRGYQPGDSLRRINWKSSARHPDELFSNEFEQERVADVGLILDARRRTDIVTPRGALFEHGVSAMAALAQALLNDGNRVGLLVYGGFLDWTFPGYGKIQGERILQALARAATGESLVFDRLENLPRRIFPSGSQIVLVSPLLEDDLPILVRLRANGYQVLVVSPDPVSFAAAGDGQVSPLAVRLARMERDLLLARLRHAGVQTLSWEVSAPFDQAMHHLLSRPAAWIHPLGGRL